MIVKKYDNGRCLTLAKNLKDKYHPENVEIPSNSFKNKLLSESIIPSNTFVFSGHGATLYTNKGKIIDLASMTVNCILGQNDVWVNANLIAYILSGRPSFLTTRLGSDFYYRVAKRITEVVGMREAVINHRQCNGSDVTELAVMAAYRHKKKKAEWVASFKGSYHGQNLTAYLISDLQKRHSFLIRKIPVVYLKSPTNSNIDEDLPLSKQDRKILDELFKKRHQMFAVIIEPIQVNNNVNVPSKAFMKKLKEICEEEKISLIFDEVQTGFGWLGKMTAAERYGVYPNLMALSKALTAGYGPLSVLVSDRKYRDIREGSGAKTNGADLRSLVAANTVINRLMGIKEDQIPSGITGQLKEELKTGLLKLVPSKSELLSSFLNNLKRKNGSLIDKISGDGLIRGIRITNRFGVGNSVLTKKLQQKLLESGVLVRYSGHSLIFKPPITIKEEEMGEAFRIIEKVMLKIK